MSEFTFLEEEQIFGDKALDIIKKYGAACAITDFSILLGGYVSSNYYTSEGSKDRTGYYWTKTDDGDNDARVVSDSGHRDYDDVYYRYGGCRPALPYSSIKSICSNVVRDNFGIKEVEYGEYPQTIVDVSYSRELERAYNNGNIKVTGKTYTTDSVNLDDYDTSFQPRQHQEFEYNGRKYIRIVADSNCDGEVLSDGRTIKAGQAYWVAVEPIKWLVDERANIALSKKIIFSGVQFKKTRDYKGDFNRTDIKQFIDKHFSKDIIANKNSIDLSNINLTLIEVEPEVVESLEPIEQPIIEEPHRTIFDFFRRKNKVNPNYVSVLKSELDTLSYDILFNVPDGPEKWELIERLADLYAFYIQNDIKKEPATSFIYNALRSIEEDIYKLSGKNVDLDNKIANVTDVDVIDDSNQTVFSSDPDKVFETEDDYSYVTDEDVFKNQQSTSAKMPELVISGVNNSSKGYFKARRERKNLNVKLAEENNALMNDICGSIIELPKGKERTECEERFNWLYGYYNREYYNINSKKPTPAEQVFTRKKDSLVKNINNYTANLIVDSELDEIKENVQRKI